MKAKLDIFLDLLGAGVYKEKIVIIENEFIEIQVRKAIPDYLGKLCTIENDLSRENLKKLFALL